MIATNSSPYQALIVPTDPNFLALPGAIVINLDSKIVYSSDGNTTFAVGGNLDQLTVGNVVITNTTIEINGAGLAQGFTGSIGGLGYTGSQGAGFTGSPSTVAGPLGYTGSYGPVGFTGSQGNIGNQGDTGFIGSQGDIGYSGSQGDPGSPGGYAGSQGVQGFTGSIGFTGSQGAGFTGSQGATGFVGSQGVIGFTGSAAGFTGSQGVIGFTGSQGVIGFTGSQGIQGIIGYTGSTGAGFTGSQGTTGFVGSPGPSAGSNTDVTFNDSGAANGLPGFTYIKTTNNVFIGNTLSFGNSSVNSIANSLGFFINNIALVGNTVNAVNGYVWVGGIMIQWCLTAQLSASTNVNWPTKWPVNAYAAVTSLNTSTAQGGAPDGGSGIGLTNSTSFVIFFPTSEDAGQYFVIGIGH